jgi:hypothetical protein
MTEFIFSFITSNSSTQSERTTFVDFKLRRDRSLKSFDFIVEYLSKWENASKKFNKETRSIFSARELFKCSFILTTKFTKKTLIQINMIFVFINVYHFWFKTIFLTLSTFWTRRKKQKNALFKRIQTRHHDNHTKMKDSKKHVEICLII